MNTTPLLAAAFGVATALASGHALAQTATTPNTSAGSGTATTQSASTAATEDDSDARPISLAALVGFGTGGLNLGIGVRGGYTLPMKIYIGGTFMYHFGSSTTVLGMTSSTSSFYPGVELGYDIPAGPVVVRPYGGLGLVFSTASASSFSLPPGATYSTSTTNFAFWPGATVIYPLGSAFVGGDARFLFASSTTFTVAATGGLRF